MSDSIKVDLDGVEFSVNKSNVGEVEIVVDGKWSLRFDEEGFVIDADRGYFDLVSISPKGVKGLYRHRDVESGECLDACVFTSDHALATCIRCGAPLN